MKATNLSKYKSQERDVYLFLFPRYGDAYSHISDDICTSHMILADLLRNVTIVFFVTMPDFASLLAWRISRAWPFTPYSITIRRASHDTNDIEGSFTCFDWPSRWPS